MSWVNRDTFSPALDSAHSIDVPASARAGSVSLLLRARLGSEQVVAQIARERVQVQAWTNAPIDGVRDGEWRAYPFAPPDGNEEATTSAAAGDGQYDFALDPAESSELDEPHPHTMLLRLKLRPLPANAATARFSITYRLVYPDGGIWWLGSAGHDAGCLIRRADPWLAVPQKAEQVVKGEEEGEEGLEVFRDVCMKETWGCWSIAHGRIEYHAQGTPTPPDASILILVPRPTAPTLALHHAIILHSARLRLTPGPHQRVLSTPGTRVYTAHAASAELAVALPALGLRWLGMHNGLALIAAPPAPADGSARIAAVPLLFDPATPPGILRVDLPTCFPANDDDEAARHLQADGYAVYAPASRRVVGIDGPQVRLKVAHVGGTALVSAMHALPVIDGASGAEAAWRIAVLTPHALVLGVPEQEHEHEHDHEADHRRDEEPTPKPNVAPAPVPIPPPAAVPNPRPKPTTTETATQATPDRRSFPRRIIAYVLPLVWRTVALLCRAVLVRVFGLVGLHPPSLLLSILALALPDSKEPRREVPYVVRRERALDLQYTGSRTASGSEESVVLAGHEKEGTGTTHVGEEEEHDHKPASAHKRVRTLSDATTATISPARASLHFRVPDGPLSIFALPGAGIADEKVVFSAELDKAQVRDVVRALEIVLDGVRVPVAGGKVDGGVASKAPGAAVLESFAPVRAGALEVLGGALL